MSAEPVSLIEKHISTEVILSSIKNPALVMSLSGKVARLNPRCRQYLPDVREGRSLSDYCEEAGVFGSLRKMICHARSASGLHPCRLQTKSPETPGSWLGFFSVLCSQITHKPIAILLEVDDHKVERENRLLALDQEAENRLTVLRQFHQDGIHDPLTGLKNRRYMDSFLKMECDLIKRQSVGGTLVVVDIDHFKRINDTYGHLVGDEVIRMLANLLRQRLRTTDLIGRYGGEEFVVALPGCGATKAVEIIDELRESFAQFQFSAGGDSFTSSFSAGVKVPDGEEDLQALLTAADARLYAAKKAGRNRVVGAAATAVGSEPSHDQDRAARQP